VGRKFDFWGKIFKTKTYCIFLFLKKKLLSLSKSEIMLMLGSSKNKNSKDDPKILHFELKEKFVNEKLVYSGSWFCQAPTFKDSHDDPSKLSGFTTIVHQKNVYLYGGTSFEKLNKDIIILYTGNFYN
jgi:hypothetical protein